VRLSQSRSAVSVRFDDPNLVSCAGLVPVMRLAETAGLAGLVTERIRLGVSTVPIPTARLPRSWRA
jgi:hypothetical protein